MSVDVSLEDIDGIESCSSCGILVDYTRVELIPKENQWDEQRWICPVCKTENIKW